MQYIGLDTPDTTDDSASPNISVGVELSRVVKDLRRSQRVIFGMPVNVYVHRENEDPAFEAAKTLTVNAHGALLALTMPVAFGQKLRLINPRTHKEIDCHVCRFAMRYPSGVTQVVVEFEAAAPTFWDVPSPPPDWDPTRVPQSERMHLEKPARLPLEIPVLLYAHEENQAPSCIEGRTLSVNMDGALLAVGDALYTGQSLLLINYKTKEEILCHVRSVDWSGERVNHVGVEFSFASPKFWGVTFRPEGDLAEGLLAQRRSSPVNAGRSYPLLESLPSELEIYEPEAQLPDSTEGIVEPDTELEIPAVVAVSAIPSDTKPNSRRSNRLAFEIPVVVQAQEENAVYVEGKTIDVNVNGALLAIPAALRIGQSLHLTNSKTGKEIVCNVRSVRQHEPGMNRAGVEFETASPRFWGINFLPEDWNAAERKLPQRPMPMKAASLKPSHHGVTGDSLNETEMLIEEAVRVQETFEARRGETKPKRPLPTKAAALNPAHPGSAAPPLTNLQRIIGETQKKQRELLKTGEVETRPAGWRVFRWPIIALAACVVLFIIWISMRRASEGSSVSLQKSASAGIAAEDAKMIPNLEGFRLATAEDFDPEAVAWLRGAGQPANGEIPGTFTAFGQSKAYALIGKNAMWRIVILADGKLRCDAEYRSVVIIARVPKQAIQHIVWANPPPGGSEGDGLLVVRAANDLGSSVVLLLQGNEVVSGTPSSYQQIPLAGL